MIIKLKKVIGKDINLFIFRLKYLKNVHHLKNLCFSQFYSCTVHQLDSFCELDKRDIAVFLESNIY